jgi:hypothetical protein
LNGYHLCEQDELYYLVRDKRSAAASASASASDPVIGVITHKKSGSVLLPPLGFKFQPGQTSGHAELWTDVGHPPAAASSESPPEFWIISILNVK